MVNSCLSKKQIDSGSHTMYFGVSYFVRYFDKTPKICCYGLIASYCTPKKCFV